MANLCALMTHCPLGTKALVGRESDIFIYEAGGASVCGGIVYEAIPTQADGRLLIGDLEAAFPDDPEDPQFALPGLICLENTHNRCGGTVLPLAYLREVAEFARAKQVPVHMDGARIFNAATALKVPPAEIARYATSLQFCLSKGLAAPLGSMLVGDAAFIKRAHRIRKLLGGGMRQTGIIAAAGLIALEQMVERLQEDHVNARRFAEGLAELPGIQIDLETVQTNIVIFRVLTCDYRTFIELAARRGLRIGELGYGRLRAVFHYGNTSHDVDEALSIIRAILTLDLCTLRG